MVADIWRTRQNGCPIPHQWPDLAQNTPWVNEMLEHLTYYKNIKMLFRPRKVNSLNVTNDDLAELLLSSLCSLFVQLYTTVPATLPCRQSSCTRIAGAASDLENTRIWTMWEKINIIQTRPLKVLCRLTRVLL